MAAVNITSNGGVDAATVVVEENASAVTTVLAAHDPEATVVYSIDGGVDQALFEIDALTGALRFKAAPDFELPADLDRNNSYVIRVKASDGALSDIQWLSVYVTDSDGKTVEGDETSNVLISEENDTLLGGEGDDTLISGAGADVIDGGSGVDTLVVDWSGLSTNTRMTPLTSSADGYSGSLSWVGGDRVASPNWEMVVPHAAFGIRDAAVGFEFGGYYWLSNAFVEAGVPAVRDLWRSRDGVQWDRVTSQTPYDEYSPILVHENELWAVSRTIWRSSDGVNWVDASQQDRSSNLVPQAAVVFNEKIFVFDSEAVWSITDDQHWVREASLPVPLRFGFSVVAFDGKLFLMNGGAQVPSTPPELWRPDYTSYNDLWSSTDGVHWTRVAEHGPWAERIWGTLLVHEGNLYLIGGLHSANFTNLDDVWISKDGENWSKLDASISFPPRHAATLFSIGDDIVMAAGHNYGIKNDILSLEIDRQFSRVEFAGIERFDLTLGSGNDTVAGGLGDDIVRAGPGDDVFIYGGGFDVFDGESGSDTLDMSGPNEAIVVDLANIGAQVRTLSDGALRTALSIPNVENIIGTTLTDQFYGDSNPNTYVYTGGFDTFDGRGGADTLDMSRLPGAVWINLVEPSGVEVWTTSTGVISQGSWRRIVDTRSVENIVGTQSSDEIYGDAADNVYTYTGGVDIFDGKAGNDTLDMSRLQTAVWINLTDAGAVDVRTAQTGGQNLVDTRQVENVIGTAWDDQIYANDASNIYTYIGGYDIFEGKGGNDTLDMSRLEGAVWVNLTEPGGIEVWTTSSGVISQGDWRTIVDTQSVENIIGTIRNDEIYGDGANNAYAYTDGFDIFDGKGGMDTLDMSRTQRGVWADFTDASGIEVWTIAIADEVGERVPLVNVLAVENFIGTPADDFFYATADDNTYVYTGGFDVFDGKAGRDTLDLSTRQWPVWIDLMSANQIEVWATGTNDVLNGTRLPVVDVHSVENIIGTAGNDHVLGDNVDNDYVYTGGLDTFTGRGGSDTIDLSRITGAVVVDFANASGIEIRAGGVEIVNISSVENVVGTSGNDEIYADAANNTYTYTGGLDIFDGKGGVDTLDMSRLTGAVWISMTEPSGIEVWTTSTGVISQGDWRRIVDTRSVENVIGTSRNDEIYGDAAKNMYTYTGGVDIFDGKGGSDTLDMTRLQRAVWINLADAVDVRTAATGGQNLVDTRGVENFIGTAWNDEIYADDAQNTYTYIGGYDIFDGKGGSDTLDMSRLGGAVWVNLMEPGGVEVWTTSTGIISQGVWRTIVDTRSVENIVGTDRNDEIYGDASDNIYTYLGGFDIFNGKNGADTLDLSRMSSGYWVNLDDAAVEVWTTPTGDLSQGDRIAALNTVSVENVIGAAGNDTIFGSAGVNRIAGGRGVDLLGGDGGADTFAFGLGDSHDKIMDFSSAQGDRLELSQLLSPSGLATPADAFLHAYQLGSDTVFDFGGGDSLTLIGVQLGSLLLSDIVVI